MQRDFSSEIEIKATRSSGKGGQNVNKVSTKVEAMWNVTTSALLSEEEKAIIHKKLKLSQEGILRVVCEETRHQLKNKELALKKLHHIIASCLKRPKKRIATKPTKASKIRRVLEKKIHAEKKGNRKKNDFSH